MTIDDRHEMNRGLSEGEYTSIEDINRIYGPQLMSTFGITQEMLDAKSGFARKRKFYYTTIHVIHAVRNGALQRTIARSEMENDLSVYLTAQFEKGAMGDRIDNEQWVTRETPPIICDMLYETPESEIQQHQERYQSQLPMLHKNALGRGVFQVAGEQDVLCGWLYRFFSDEIIPLVDTEKLASIMPPV